MANLLIANQEKYVPKCLLAVNDINQYDKLEGLQPEAADWHAKVNLYEANTNWYMVMMSITATAKPLRLTYAPVEKVIFAHMSLTG